MKTNPDDDAFATPSQFDADGREMEVGESGLTKREYFAAMAMLSFQKDVAAFDEPTEGYYERNAIASVRMADALIAELNKSTT